MSISGRYLPCRIDSIERSVRLDEPVGEGPGLAHQRLDLVVDGIALPHVGRDDEVAAAVEVAVDGAPGDLRLAGDVVDGGAPQAEALEAHLGGVEQPLAGVVLVVEPLLGAPASLGSLCEISIGGGAQLWDIRRECPVALPSRPMGKLDGKVAFITGAGRGQGRAHAVRLAQDGADIIALDICAQIESVSYPMATPDDLARTVKEVEDLGRRCVGFEADVRDVAAVRQAFDDGTAALGAVEVVVANAGIAPMTVDPEHPDGVGDVLDVNITGVYNTVRVAIPSMIEAGNGGSIVLISSVAGVIGSGGNSPGMLAYTASKHGVVGLMRAWANYLAPHNIRVNSVAPTGVRTPMVFNAGFPQYVAAHPEFANLLGNSLPVDMVDAVDIANAVAWLASDEARYVTGTVLPVDAGAVNNR